jgi:hypothetical protein
MIHLFTPLFSSSFTTDSDAIHSTFFAFNCTTMFHSMLSTFHFLPSGIVCTAPPCFHYFSFFHWRILTSFHKLIKGIYFNSAFPHITFSGTLPCSSSFLFGFSLAFFTFPPSFIFLFEPHPAILFPYMYELLGVIDNVAFSLSSVDASSHCSSYSCFKNCVLSPAPGILRLR